MLIRARDLKNRSLRAIDGDLGKVKDFYFDDQNWVIRYMLVETSIWLSGRNVLISPYSVRQDLDPQYSGIIPVALTKEQVKNSPSLEDDVLPSREFENRYYAYYNWPAYWAGQDAWGDSAYPLPGSEGWVYSDVVAAAAESHLRSMADVGRYDLECIDGFLGHLHDFIVDEETQKIRYLVINTRDFLPGKRVLISPEWVSYIDWAQYKVKVDLTQSLIKAAPAYNDELFIDREYERALFDHYGRTVYWV